MAAARTPIERLQDIAECIGKIGRFLAGKTFDDFASDALVHDAVVRNLEIISEASRHITSELKAEVPEVPWRKVADMGNWLRHAYEKTEDKILWETIEQGLPALDAAVRRLLIRHNSPPR
ncbi:MAG TPA: HepT-like ribonuclease domain-containing protein [Rhizomicrobium sp.]|nr:HepT-like ribonuclease domain-containing protein [Rhizomicrobium sp.]